jgi:zinc protease
MWNSELTLREGRTFEEAEKAVDGVLADLRQHPPTEAELRRALNDQEMRLVAQLEVLGGMSGRVERLQTYNHYLGDPGKLAWDVGRYRKVTAADVSRVLDTYLGPNRLIVYGQAQKKKGGAS